MRIEAFLRPEKGLEHILISVTERGCIKLLDIAHLMRCILVLRQLVETWERMYKIVKRASSFCTLIKPNFCPKNGEYLNFKNNYLTCNLKNNNFFKLNLHSMMMRAT